MKLRVYVRTATGNRTHQLFFDDPHTGKRHTKSSQTRNMREALRAAARWESELNKLGYAGSILWPLFRQRFEDEKLAGLRLKTRQCYSSALNKLETIVGETTELDQVNAQLLSELQSNMRREGLTESTIATHLRHIRSALNWGVSMGYLAKAPAVAMPKPEGKRLARGRALTWQEVVRFIHAADVMGDDAQSWKLLIRGLYLSGLRLQEALRLSWNEPPVQLDLTGGKRPRIIWHASGQKSNKDEVTPITPKFAQFLNKLTPNGLVLAPKIRGRPISYDRTVKGMVEFGKLAGIKTVEGKTASAHDFRRSFGQYWAKRLKPLQLKKIMRHSSMETTLKYYVDLEFDDVAEDLWK